MRLAAFALIALVASALPTLSAAQQRDTLPTRRPLGAGLGDARAPSQGARSAGGQPGTPHYDVVLEVPELSIDSIGLEVDDLDAHLALDAQVASLVVLTAGVDVGIEQVNLRLEGVYAEAYLYVDLDNVAQIVDRALTTLENNPQILAQLLATVDTAVGVVGRVGAAALAPGGLLSETVDAAGRTVQTALTSTGSIVERTLNASGGLLTENVIGSVTRLPLVRETTNSAGATVRRVRDTAGNLIEYTLGTAGAVSGLRVVERAVH